MFIYLFFEILLILLAYLYRRTNRSFVMIVCLLILFVLMGLNDWSQAQADYPSYVDFFTGKGSGMYGSIEDKNNYELELTYYYFCKFLRILGSNEFIYVFGVFLTFVIPFFLLVKKYSTNPPLSFFLLLTILQGSTYLYFIAAHRQMVAISLLTIAFLIYSSKIKHRKILSLILGICALIGHSSMYLAMPFFLFFMFVPFSFSKRTNLIILISSFVLGIILYGTLGQLYQEVFSLLDVQEDSVIERAAYYASSDEDNYQLGTAVRIGELFVVTLTVALFILYSSKDQLKSFFLKLMIFGTSLYNLFSMIPLANRNILLFVLFGIAGAIPEGFRNKKRGKLAMGIIMIFNLYLAYRAMSKPGFRLEYHSILSEL